jgi:hypothetical protein
MLNTAQISTKQKRNNALKAPAVQCTQYSESLELIIAGMFLGGW